MYPPVQANAAAQSSFRTYGYVFLAFIFAIVVASLVFVTITSARVEDIEETDNAIITHLVYIEQQLVELKTFISTSFATLTTFITTSLATLTTFIDALYTALVTIINSAFATLTTLVTAQYDSLFNTINTCCTNISLSIAALSTLIVNKFAIVFAYNTASAGVISTHCDDGNVCTVDLLRFNGTSVERCENANLRNGHACADNCLDPSIVAPTCVSGKCTGVCKGQCQYNFMVDPLDACLTDRPLLNILATNNSGVAVGTNIAFVALPVISSICLERTCLFTIPVSNPNTWMFGALFVSDPTANANTGDHKIYDAMCQSLLDTSSGNECFRGYYSSLGDTPKCLFIRSCSTFSFLAVDDSAYVGKRVANKLDTVAVAA